MQKLREHEFTHTGEKPCQCRYCPKAFRTAIALKSHERLHTGERPYRCTVSAPKCPISPSKHRNDIQSKKGFQSTSLIDSFCRQKLRCCHQVPVPIVLVSVTLQICGKSFTQHPHLKSHILIHTGERPYKCAHCNKGFMTRGHLASHESVHTGLKPHKCKQ